MEEEERKQAASAANALLLNAAIRAIMRSHPDPAGLRAAWDQSVAEIGRAMLAGYADSIENTSAIAEEFRRQKAAMEQDLPRG
jgi:hypothetical protein